MQPQNGQEPPTRSRSMTATLAPSERALKPAASPAGPAPMTAMSKRSMGASSGTGGGSDRRQPVVVDGGRDGGLRAAQDVQRLRREAERHGLGDARRRQVRVVEGV